MDATTETMSVERTLSIDASPEAVWEFLVDPDKATRWMGQTCTFEAEPGGLYRCEVIPGHTARGEFVELDAPHRLVFTWGWENEERTPPGSSTVEIELVEIERLLDSQSGTPQHRDQPLRAGAVNASAQQRMTAMISSVRGGSGGWRRRPVS